MCDFVVNRQIKWELNKVNVASMILLIGCMKAFRIIWVMVTAILLFFLGFFFGVSFMNIFTIGLLVTGISYLVGDLLILSRAENWVATIADFVLTFAIV